MSLSSSTAVVVIVNGRKASSTISLMSPLPPKIKGSSPALAICFIGDIWTKQATIRVSVAALYVVLALLPRRSLSTLSRRMGIMIGYGLADDNIRRVSWYAVLVSFTPEHDELDA